MYESPRAKFIYIYYIYTYPNKHSISGLTCQTNKIKKGERERERIKNGKVQNPCMLKKRFQASEKEKRGLGCHVGQCVNADMARAPWGCPRAIQKDIY